MLKDFSPTGDTVPAIKFRLKSRESILKLGKTPNAHQVAMRSRISWTTISRYLAESDASRDTMCSIDLGVIYAILTDGLGLTEEEAMELKISDIFEVSKRSE